ncbi:MAG: DMT family transporter [Candidatus Thorarchaeota archaeon]
MKNRMFISRIQQIIQTRPFSIFQAFFVTLLWSSSWPIIKFGLEKEEIPPITFAGLRYISASLILFSAVLISSKQRKILKTINRRWWLKLVLYGLIFYTITQGAQFFGLLYQRAITVSMLLSFSPILVLILAIFLIKEKPSKLQILVVIIALLGAFLYFFKSINLDLTTMGILALVIVIIGVLANALSAIMGRSINKSQELNPLIVTSTSMLVGSIVLLIVGLTTEDIPKLSLLSIGYILWLSIVNTAFAFTLWNHAMQKLAAVEISIINNTMLVQITILAVIFLSERPTVLQWIGLTIIAISGILLPLFSSKNNSETKNKEELII